MLHLLFNNITDKNKTDAIDDLMHDSTPRPSFFFLVILSVLMATFGLILNNASVIIGSMLIAPILSPILSLALGVVTGDGKIMGRSFYTLLKSTGYGLAFAIVATWFFGAGVDLTNPEIASRTNPSSFLYFAIAIVAGLATAFARVKPELNEALPGTAIAVALVPPLAVSGIGIATFQWSIAAGAFQMYLLNAAGIILAAMIMFNIMHLYTKRELAANAQAREDRQLERQKKSLENLKKKIAKRPQKK